MKTKNKLLSYVDKNMPSLLADLQKLINQPSISATNEGIDELRNIIIDFDNAVDPSTVNSSTIRVFGQWAGIMPGVFTLEESNHQVRFTPANAFSAGEHITITISKIVFK